MTASTDLLGTIHADLAQLYKEIVSVREEAVYDRDGEPVYDKKTGEPLTRRVFPTAAELAQVNAFLKNNNITAKGEDGGALDELRELVAKRQAKRPPVLADPYDALPQGFGGMQ